ncbi:MAG: hypothetical protein PHZ27_06115, partial [Candidatus Omnitrophica bacterium]|nr:hypothetical protein [Candidatus Omnitrophota bacterium]
QSKDFKGAASDVFKRINEEGVKIPETIRATFNMQGDLKDGWYTWISDKDLTPNIGEGLDLANKWVNGINATSTIEIDGKKISESEASVSFANGKFQVSKGEDFKWLTMPIESKGDKQPPVSYQDRVTVTATSSPFVGSFNSKEGIPVSLQNGETLFASNPIIANNKILAGGSAQPDVLHFQDYTFKSADGKNASLFIGGSLKYFGDGSQLSYTNNDKDVNGWSLQYSEGAEIAGVFNEPFLASNQLNIARFGLSDNSDTSRIFTLGSKNANTWWVAKKDARGEIGIVPKDENKTFSKYFSLADKAIYSVGENQYESRVVDPVWNKDLKTFTFGVEVKDNPINFIRNQYNSGAPSKGEESNTINNITVGKRVKSLKDNIGDLRSIENYHTDLKITGESTIKEIVSTDKKTVLGWVDSATGVLGLGIDFYGNLRSLAGLPGSVFSISDERAAMGQGISKDGKYGLSKNTFFINDNNADFLAVWGGKFLVDYQAGSFGTNNTKFLKGAVYDFENETYEKVDGTTVDLLTGKKGNVLHAGYWDDAAKMKTVSKTVDLLIREAKQIVAVDSNTLKFDIFGMKTGYFNKVNKVKELQEKIKNATGDEKTRLQEELSFTKESLQRIIDVAKEEQKLYGEQNFYAGQTAVLERNPGAYYSLFKNRGKLFQKKVDSLREEKIDITAKIGNDGQLDFSGSIKGNVTDLSSGVLGDIAKYSLSDIKGINNELYFSAKGTYWQAESPLFQQLVVEAKGNGNVEDKANTPATKAWLFSNSKGGVLYDTKKDGSLIFDAASLVPTLKTDGPGSVLSFRQGDAFYTRTKVDANNKHVDVEGITVVTSNNAYVEYIASKSLLKDGSSVVSTTPHFKVKMPELSYANMPNYGYPNLFGERDTITPKGFTRYVEAEVY